LRGRPEADPEGMAACGQSLEGFGVPNMIGVEEVKVHPEAGCSDRSEPQSVEREDGVKEAGSRTAGRWTRTAYEAPRAGRAGQRPQSSNTHHPSS